MHDNIMYFSLDGKKIKDLRENNGCLWSNDRAGEKSTALIANLWWQGKVVHITGLRFICFSIWSKALAAKYIMWNYANVYIFALRLSMESGEKSEH